MTVKCPKIIVRNKKTPRAAISSQFNLMVAERDFSNLKEFVSYYGISKIMTELLGESFEEDSLESSILYEKYLEVLESGNDNDYFYIMFKLREDMAVKLTEHISIYHLVAGLSIAGKSLLPWYYSDTKRYIADTWWENDEDILNDLFNMNFVDFMVKYKGY